MDNEKKRKRVLVIAPHQDDETLGVGCSIFEHRRAGDEVSVVVLTDGSYLKFGEAMTPAARASMSPHWDKVTEWYVQLRESETLRAMSVLGVEERMVTFFGFPDTRLSHFVPECAERLLGVLRQKEFDIVYTPSDTDVHKDHRAASEIALLALRRLYLPDGRERGSTHAPVVRMYAIGNPGAKTRPSLPQGRVMKRSFSKEAAERKVKALRIYRTQYSQRFRRFETNTEEFFELDLTKELGNQKNRSKKR